MIELYMTGRGFRRGDFKDHNDAPCSIQESSIADEDGIWLGLEHEQKHPTTGEPMGARMHLDRTAAANIVMHLQRFIETGNL